MTVRSKISFIHESCIWTLYAKPSFTTRDYAPLVVELSWLASSSSWTHYAISSFSGRNQTDLLSCYSSLINSQSVRGLHHIQFLFALSHRCSTIDLLEWAQFLSGISLIHCNSPSPASTRLLKIIQFLSPGFVFAFSFWQLHQPPIASLPNSHTHTYLSVCIALDFQKSL